LIDRLILRGARAPTGPRTLARRALAPGGIEKYRADSPAPLTRLSDPREADRVSDDQVEEILELSANHFVARDDRVVVLGFYRDRTKSTCK
jgi:hypothetical protein